ncbi:MAG TPA: flagellar hook capping FlgD N-terminal domain-containing protein [Terriglobia bacterium]|jgi:flagellar basal-body rod modification protein FlgD|nr:flagellar hook capping FlgD N-terminal domain-containing protein [Terriglobia bacterium]
MQVDDVSGATSQTTQSVPQKDLSGDAFLTLLVEQLKNQDPTQPTDPTQFVSQLVQFNQLEQLIQIRQLIQGTTTTGTASTSN